MLVPLVWPFEMVFEANITHGFFPFPGAHVPLRLGALLGRYVSLILLLS